ncbi:MAG TPA: FAD binding domain-containing protein [Actinomycetes bacterium]
MKPSPFDYNAPESLEEALSVLARVGGDGKVLAGGQSLLPILNMRLAAPAHIVDINRVAELAYVRVEPDAVHVGALARHADVERDEAAHGALPLLRQALQLVAHPVIRNRGTTVGSLAHADPSGEMTAVLALTGGSVTAARQGATREIAAADFFAGPLESSLEPGELAVSARFPRFPGRTGTAFVEVARRHGDYAVCGLAAAVTLDASGAVESARAAYISMAPTPLVLDLTEAVTGRTPAAADWSAAGEVAGGQVEPEADIHASVDYRRHLARVLTARALAEAAGRAA